MSPTYQLLIVMSLIQRIAFVGDNLGFEQSETIYLSDRDRDRFLESLENPPGPNAALLRPAERFREAVVSGEFAC